MKTSEYKPVVNWENRDTIGMIALDAKGDLSGACTTSGMAYKLHGRVGDSPSLAPGCLLTMKSALPLLRESGGHPICGSHLVVELMRQGNTPEDACRIAVERIVKNQPEKSKNIQVGFLALNKHGEYGACLRSPVLTMRSVRPM